MIHDFDTPLPLRGAHSQKWDDLHKVMGDALATIDAGEVIPMWVADMDHATAPAIRQALADEVARGFFGYFGDAGPVTEAVTGWLSAQHGWQVAPEAVRYSVGVIGGLRVALHAFSAPGDGVILFSPVYHAFYRVAKAMGRRVVESPLRTVAGRFEMDLDALEAGLTGREKLLILCSPHNPGGRLWSGDEIRAVADLCARHGIVLVSDEIHMDLTHPGARHLPTALAAPDALSRLVFLGGASKAFNIAGGETGVAVIPDPELRAVYDRANAAVGASPNRFGMVMLQAAFNGGGDWSQAVRAHIAGNFALWRDRIGALPGVSVMDMAATYLTWVDFTGTGLSEPELQERIGLGARIAASPGTQFGTGGDGFMRFNIAMPRPLLCEAIDRIERAFADLQ